MEPTGKKEPNASMAIVATYTTACLLDDAEFQLEPSMQREESKPGVKSRLIAGASDLLRRDGRKSR